MRVSNILRTDSYKASHYLQLPQDVRRISSYIEARKKSGAIFGGDELVFFGLQGWIKEYLCDAVTKADIAVAENFWNLHGLPFNRLGWEIIVEEHHGILPIHIQAIPEGTVIAPGNVLVQVTNTDERLPWLSTYVETQMLRAVWYPTTVASRSRDFKKLIQRFLDETSDDTTVNFKLHDFGARGVSSAESAEIGGAAHLTSFMGTDTAEGALWTMKNYGGIEMPGFSIPAAEHSTICAWGPTGEEQAFANMVDKFGGPGKIYAVVSDTYDVHHAVKVLWGKNLREKVIDRGGVLVVRPDSGTPHRMVLSIISALGDTFGFSMNSKGYRVLHPAVRAIQGDGNNHETVQKILQTLKDHGWAAENVAFGMGGELLQAPSRDTYGFAMKASAVDHGAGWLPVFKNPASDPGKRSRGGRLALVKIDGKHTTVRESEVSRFGPNLLEDVWNKRLLRDQKFPEVRALAA